MRLTIELVPETCFFKNLRSEITREAWDKIRKDCYAKANYICEVCGGKGAAHPVECHEIWEYNDEEHVQKLLGVVALCPMCHAVKHLGRSIAVGNGAATITHLMQVNNLTMEAAADYIKTVWDLWALRNKHQWTLDISWVYNRMKAKVLRTIYCCECKAEVEAYLTDGKEVYPHREDLYDLPFWRCPHCNNHVGCHHKTEDPTRPLGYIPTPAIAHWRRLIHEKLDSLWKTETWTRKGVYAWMTKELGWKFHVSCIRTVKEAETAYLLLDRIPKTQEEAEKTKAELDRVFGE